MNANSTPTLVSGTQLTTSALFDDLCDCKSLNLSAVGRGVGIEIATPQNKSWVVKGVALLPLFQLVSSGVRFEIQLLCL